MSDFVYFMLMSHDIFVEALGKVEVKWFKDRVVTSQDFRHVFVLKKNPTETIFCKYRVKKKSKRLESAGFVAIQLMQKKKG